MREFINLVETAAASEVRVYHVTPKRNLPKIMREGLLPKRGARSRSANEKQHAIYVFPDWTSVEDGMSNWLLDQFGEETPMCVLELTVPKDWLVQDKLRWEAIITQPVPPERIRVIVDDIDEWDGKAPENAVWHDDDA